MANEGLMKQKDIRVLVVDDEKDFANTLAQRLKLRNLTVNIAYDGEEALTKLKEAEQDVIVLDLKMPGLHGMEVLEEIKKTYPDMQVIVLTGHGNDSDEEEVKRLGGFGFLNKPADIETLEYKIQAAFKKKVERTLAANAIADNDQ
jgi:DNA-binding NtrC family response regulator